MWAVLTCVRFVNLQYIIELGLAYVSWQKGNAAPPRVRAEHISELRRASLATHPMTLLTGSSFSSVIAEHKDKRNGLYSPDAKDVRCIQIFC